ncbi:MAG: serine hydrolase [Saprospiraceae bacterium]|nr:serine hydrolase [Saprospiraceae bacterium]
MKKTLLLSFLVGLTFTIEAQNKDLRWQGLDKELDEMLDTWQAASFAVAVVEKDKIVYAKGFGYADYENKVKADEHTLYAIGSCSKAFTSSLLGLLRADDKLDFDDSPRDYIPELTFYNSELNNLVTIKDMMSHRTGLPRHDFAWYLFPTDSKDTLIQRIAHQEPFTGVREQWYYNNFMFMAQGVIAEKLTGKSWGDNIKEKLFAPLGMKRSNISIPELEKSENVAKGYELDDDEIKLMDYYRIRAMGPAGSINSSVTEMANWMVAWINGGQFEGKEVLPANYVQEAMSSQMVVSGGVPGEEYPDLHMANYGYGWFLSSYRGHYRVEHGGNIDGFSANTSFFPSDSIGIVVLVNQNGSVVPSMVRNTVADRVLQLPKREWSKERKKIMDEAEKAQEEAASASVSNQKEGTRASHIAEAYAGKYEHPGYGTFRVKVKGDSLFAFMPLQKVWLKHFHYDIFQPFSVEEDGIDEEDESPLRFNFATNDAGEVASVSIKIEPMVDAISFKRVPEVVAIEKAALEQYVGVYLLGPQEAKVFIKPAGTLHLFTAGQPEYELQALGQNKFSIKGLQGFVVEFMVADGKANEAVFRQPNGTFIAKRKQ